MTDGAVPESEYPDSPSKVAAVLGAHGKAIENLEHASTTHFGLLRETSNHVLTVLAEVRGLTSKLDVHVGDSVTRSQILAARVNDLEKTAERKKGSDDVEASIKKNWVVPLGRAAIGALLLLGVVAFVGTIVARPKAAVDAETIKLLKDALKEIP